MPIAKHFIEQGVKLVSINEYLRKELTRAGFAGVDIQKTPLGTRITLKTSRPGLVIGKGGKRIQEITDVLRDKYGLELPQIEVEEVKNPDLDAQIMAERLAYSLERGRHYRRAAYYIIRKVMDAGALGVEVRVSGKVTSQRARDQLFKVGRVIKAGYPAQIAVGKGVAHAMLKSGVMGVVVRINRPGYPTGCSIEIKEEELSNFEKQKEVDIAKAKTQIKAPSPEPEYKITEETVERSAKDLIDDVNEEDIEEISLEPTNEEKELKESDKKK